jgi:hypothetical protein
MLFEVFVKTFRHEVLLAPSVPALMKLFNSHRRFSANEDESRTSPVLAQGFLPPRNGKPAPKRESTEGLRHYSAVLVLSTLAGKTAVS